MIDTIKFSLHNVKSRYADLLKQITVYVEGKTFFKEDEKKPLFMYYQIKEGSNYDERVVMKKKLYIPSSSRYVNCIYMYQKDELIFEFSIPKMLYGTNVFEFIKNPYEYSSGFILSHDVKPEIQINYLRKRIYKFMDEFFHQILNRKLYRELDYINQRKNVSCISMMDLEIIRIDMCFNRIFNSFDDSVEYLQNLKLLKRKNSREIPSNAKFSYSTAIYEVTDNFTYKVYHKGYEFQKKDAPELKKINTQKGYEFYNIDEILNFANRILRYEIEFKKGGLNYLFKSKTYKKNDVVFNRYKKGYEKYVIIEKKLKRLSLNYADRKINAKKYNLYLIKLGANNYSEAYKILIEEKKKLQRAYNMYNRAVSQVSKFYLEVDGEARQMQEYLTEMETERNSNYINYEKSVLLTEVFTKILFEKFKTFVDEYTLVKKNDENLNSRKFIIKYNNRCDLVFKKTGIRQKKISGNLEKFILLLEKKSFDEIKADKYFSNSTFYDLSKKVKELGFSKNAILYKDIYSPYNYENYINEIYKGIYTNYLRNSFFI